jgi:glycosyltransferase involved in cell wall biosynthesis
VQTKKHIILTVTNDLNYDQRMLRICTSLHNAGYNITLIGRSATAVEPKTAKPLLQNPYNQKRLKCWFAKGKSFYIEYNIRLFLYLLFTRKADAYCAIDLDTIAPVYYISKIKNAIRVYDAHELFCEMEEIVRRPIIYKIWKSIEQKFVPKFTNGYTIGGMYAKEFHRMYKVNYSIVRNATILQQYNNNIIAEKKYILYQGAVNEGRSFETLIPAMLQVNATLIICGNGNRFQTVKNLIAQHQLQDKVLLKGYIEPNKLKEYTQNALIGITLFSDTGKSNYLSLANRFFDYMHAGVPQIAMAYPEYSIINTEFEIAVLLENVETQTIANALNKLLNDHQLHAKMANNTLLCKQKYCWQQEEKTLINFYNNILG